MKLYLIEAFVAKADTPYYARTWTVSQAEAASTRARYTSELGVPRSGIRTTPVDIDTRKDALVPLLNLISSNTDGFFDISKV